MTALPPSLDRFQTQLEAAIARDARARRRHPLVLRLAAAGAAAVTAVFAVGAANLVTGRGPSIVERAAAALASSGGILHVRLEQTTGDGTVWLSESWQSTSSPFEARQIETIGGRRFETEYAGGTMRVYDEHTNTIYDGAVQKGDPSRQKEGSPAKAKEVAEEPPREAGQTAPLAEKLRKSVLALLESGEARVDGHELVDGRDAIRIVSGDGALTYLVEPTTFDPIEWRRNKGGAGSVMRFPVYEELPVTEANDGLLSIAAQHPTAPVSRDEAAFRAVMAGRKAFWEQVAARDAR